MHDPFGLPRLITAPADFKRCLKAIRSAELLDAASLRGLSPTPLNATQLEQASRFGTARRVVLADNRQAAQQLIYPVSTPAQGKHDAILLSVDAQALGVARPCVDRGGVRARCRGRALRDPADGTRPAWPPFRGSGATVCCRYRTCARCQAVGRRVYPSRRTAMVREHLRSLGLMHVAEREDGGSVWSSTRCAMPRPNCR